MVKETVTLHYQVFIAEPSKKPKWVWYQEKMLPEKAWTKAQGLRLAGNVRNIGFGKLKQVI